MSTETDRKALALYPFDGSDPDTILALHAAFRAGAEFAAERAPAWDEDAAALAVFERSHEPSFEDSEEGMRAAREFVRGLQPVKPSREDVARALDPGAWSDPITGKSVWGATPEAVRQTRRHSALVQADAVLDLLPGRSEAEVRAEAWDEGAKAAWEASGEGWNGEYPLDAKHGVRNPYREGGADR